MNMKHFRERPTKRVDRYAQCWTAFQNKYDIKLPFRQIRYSWCVFWAQMLLMLSQACLKINAHDHPIWYLEAKPNFKKISAQLCDCHEGISNNKPQHQERSLSFLFKSRAQKIAHNMSTGIEGAWNSNYNWDENYHKGKHFTPDKDARDLHTAPS